MRFDNQGHIDDHSLDLYSMGRLAEPELGSVEEHLLFCHHCQTRLAATDTFVKTYRAVASQLEDEPSLDTGLRSRLAHVFFAPKPGWALALAVLALAIVGGRQWQAMRHLPEEPVAVTLEASRGGQAADISSIVPARKPLNITLDVTELPGSPAYRFEIVDTEGKQVAEARAVPSKGKIVVHISKPLPSGLHFARLYSQSGELLREFGLRIE